MAQGDVFWFEEVWGSQHSEINLDTDTFYMAILDDAATPDVTVVGPAYSGGTTDYDTDEVANGGNYATGGKICAVVGISEVGGAVAFDTGNPAVWSKTAGSPTDARYGLLYDFTTTIKHALAYIDLGASFDMTTGDLTIEAPAGGWWSEDDA